MPHGLVQLLDEVSPFIRRHFRNQFGQRAGGQARSDIRLGGDRQIAERVSTSLQLQRHQQRDIQRLFRQRANQVSNIRRIQLGNQTLNGILIAFAEGDRQTGHQHVTDHGTYPV